MTSHGPQARAADLVEVREAGLRVHRDQNVIIGLKNICRYVGVRASSTIVRWVDLVAFPAVVRPDGIWMTTMTAVDEWIFLCLLSDKAIEDRKKGTPCSQALKAAKSTGRITEIPSQNERTADYKRDWEQRTGKNGRYYDNLKRQREALKET
jgi:hypothetical protein